MPRIRQLLTADPSLSRQWDVLTYFVFFAGGAIFISGIIFALNGLPGVPTHDQWRFLARQSQADSPLDVVWKTYEHHRLVIPFLMMVADQFLTGGRNFLIQVPALAIQLAMLVAFVVLVMREKGLDAAAKRLVLGLFLTIAYFSGFISVYIIPLRIWAPVTLSFLTLSVILLAAHNTSSGGKSRVWLALSVAAAVAGSLSGVPGMFIWPTLIFTAFAMRVRRGTLIVLVGMTVLAFSVYLYGYPMAVYAPGGPGLLQSPERLVLSLGYYLGAPLAYPLIAVGAGFYGVAVSFAVGIVGLLASLWFVVGRFLRRRLETPLDIACFGVIIFALTMAASLVFKHTQPLPLAWELPLSPAYWPTVMWLWAALAVQASLGIYRASNRTILLKFLTATCVTAVMTLLPVHVYKGLQAGALRNTTEFIVLAAATGVFDEELKNTSPSGAIIAFSNGDKLQEQYAAKLMQWMKERRIAPFDIAANRAFGRLVETFPGEACDGEVLGVTTLENAFGYRLRVRWKTDNPGGHRLWLVAANGTVSGLGNRWKQPVYPIEPILQDVPADNGWIVYTRNKGDGPYRLLGTTVDGLPVCAFSSSYDLEQ